MAKESKFPTIFEDQEDYIEDIRDQLREAIKRYTLYSKMFGYPNHWKYLKDELRRFIHYELERAFSRIIIKETNEGIIMMKFEENDVEG